MVKENWDKSQLDEKRGLFKVILFKSNRTCISQYSLNCFKFLKYIFKEIDKVNKDFYGKITMIIKKMINISYTLSLVIKYIDQNVKEIQVLRE